MIDLLLVETSVPGDTGAKWYAGMVLIISTGLAGIVLIVGMMLIRRVNRRLRASIERDIAERRANRTPTNDLWSESAQRYTDPDALSDEERQARQGHQGNRQDDPEPFEGPSFNSPDPSEDFEEDEDDPYGLFRDKPYRDPEGDEDEEEGEDEDEDEADDPDR
ncbi:MAG: hypothetical protein AAGC44_12330 [Planctomycetota bacterium]